jgi:hypothetical protein
MKYFKQFDDEEYEKLSNRSTFVQLDNLSDDYNGTSRTGVGSLCPSISIKEGFFLF